MNPLWLIASYVVLAVLVVLLHMKTKQLIKNIRRLWEQTHD